MTTKPLNSVAIPSPQGVSHRAGSWQRQLRRLMTPQNTIALATLTFSIIVFSHLQQNHLLSKSGLHTLIHDSGAIAPLLFILLLALTVVMSHLPGLPLVCIAGAMWGAFGAVSIVCLEDSSVALLPMD